MQPRKHDDYVTLSPPSRMRNQHRYEIGGGHVSYPISRRGDAVGRSPRVQQRRSSSPHHGSIDGSRRILVREGSSGSTERREYSWHLGAGRTDKVRSGSPSFITEQRKLQFDEGVARRKYQYADDIKYDDGNQSRLKHLYEYDHHVTFSRMSKEKDYNENRILGIDGHVMMGQKSVPVEDDILRGSHRMPSDFDLTSNYGKTGYHLQLASRRLDACQFERERVRYQEPISSKKLTEMQFYEEEEKHVFSSRDSSYTSKPTSHSKGFGSTRFKDFAGSSSVVPRSEFPSSFREGKPLSPFDEYPRNNIKLSESMDINTYGQRPSLDMRNLQTGKKIMTGYPSGTYSPNRSEHDDFVYTRSERLVNDDSVYPSVELHRPLPLRSRSDHDQAQSDHEHGELSRMSVMHQVVDMVDPMVDSYRNARNSTIWDHSTHKQEALDNLDTNNVLTAPKYSEEYVGSGYSRLQFGRRDLRNDESAHLDTMPNQKISHLRSDFGFGRDAGPQFQKERLQDPIMSIYDLEMHKLSGKRPRMEELPIHEPSDKIVKRKFSVEEQINLPDPRNIVVSNQQYAPQEYEPTYESGEEWIDEDGNMLHPSGTRRFDQTAIRRAKRTYECQDHGDLASEEWLSSQDSFVHSRKHSVRHHKPSVKHVKGHPRTGSVAWHNSQQTDKRVFLHRKHKTCIRNDEDDYANDDVPSEDLLNMADSDLPEDSEKFKQLVHEAFLEYSKKLNLSSTVQRRYKEQGKAGSLFCIVCRRSASKEFLDTRRLVTHAFMSHKVGLRALHLGLHKAICVLMGWNTHVPCETTTWVPDFLPESEAWAQKKDLMLWPPLVIIHNVSMSINNPEKQKVIPIEGVEAFLRGKGFVGGKIKVCLGKPADQSVMLVKFLGTFTGLGIAERLDKYFSDNKRGREEFEQKKSNSRNGLEDDNNRDEVEQLLYGYIGIAEDLDELDFNTKKWITVKSKKDIEDLENAPVKTDDM